MNKILTSLVVLLLLTACKPQPEDYALYSEDPVDGYFIYKVDQTGLFCNAEYEDIYYSGVQFNYGFSYQGCSPNMTFFIKVNNEYMYLAEALDKKIVTLDSLLPYLEELERHPEEFESDEADYYWLDFHIDHDVVYAYAGGECDQAGIETFVIGDNTYTYSASGCLKNHILYMQSGDIYTPVSTLLEDGDIDPELLIPLLTLEP